MHKILFLFLTVIFLAGAASAQITLNVDIKTGDDDLQKMDYQNNPEIVIALSGGREVRKEGINRGQTWPNESLRRVTVDLPGDVRMTDLREFKLYRERNSRGRGMVWDYLKKDNWTVKSIRVTAVVREGGASRSVVLLDLNPRGGKLYRFVFDPSTLRSEGQMFMASLVPQAAPPPAAVNQNAKVTAIFGTGNDDLRGRGDNISLILKFADSPSINLDNVNQGVRWADREENTITREIPNSASIDIDKITEIVVRHDGGTRSNDEWVMSRIRVTIAKNLPSAGQAGMRGEFYEYPKILVNRTNPEVHRFTSRSRQTSFQVNSAVGQQPLRNATVIAEFTTGDDDLRGGDRDSVSLTIRFRNRTNPVIVSNISGSESWPNGSTRRMTKEIHDSGNIDINDIQEVELRHNGGRGDHVDNWTLSGFKLTITKGGQSRVLVDEVRRIVHRFTGESRRKIFMIE